MHTQVPYCAVVLLQFCVLSAAGAQTVCRSPDSTSTRFRDEIVRYTTAQLSPDDAIVRDSARLPAVSAGQVTWVTTESVCKKARTTYQQRLTGHGGTPFSGRVYVLRVGTTRYAAMDPGYHYALPCPTCRARCVVRRRLEGTMYSRALLILAVTLSCVPAVAVRAQTVCRPADSLGVAALKNEVTRYGVTSAHLSPKDAVVRDSIRLPAVGASQVTWVTTESVCTKARTAYQNRLANTGGTPFSGRVYVVKVGSTRYAVMDPEFHYALPCPECPPFRLIVVIDSQYRPLSLF